MTSDLASRAAMCSSNKEIGGYFELERFGGEPYHGGLVALNSGRGCISYLVELRSIRTVWLPDWMCDSVPRRFAREGVEVKTYRVGEDFLPTYDFEIGSGEWLYLMDYYGQLKAGDVEMALRISGGRVVVDEAQDFFRAPWPGCDTTYTCRKWFGVSDGAYVATSDGARLGRVLPADESHGRLGFVLGRFERSAGEFFEESRANNDFFDGEPAREMSPITENILRAVDYGQVVARRRVNWEVLHASLSAANGLALEAPAGPFMYPLFVDGAESIRDRLIENRVFVPVLWPNVLEEAESDSMAYRFSCGILPLPVDQRYGRRDMERILRVLQEAGVPVG